MSDLKKFLKFNCRTCGCVKMVAEPALTNEFLDWAAVEGVALICGSCNETLPKDNFEQAQKKLEAINKRIHNDKSGENVALG